MRVIEARNVNSALPQGLDLLKRIGVRRESRNGPVIVCPDPVTTIYEHPWERVLFAPERDANPFFHIFEAIYYLGGRDDLRSLTNYVARFKSYSDNGRTLHGSYGRRWRSWFTMDVETGVEHNGQKELMAQPIDQLAWAIRRLRADPNDRRVVIQMWDAEEDPYKADTGGRDVPCNTQIYVWVDVMGRLCLTVTCRSNDAIWGAHGANAVHFSFLQEYIALAVGREMGPLWQVSNNYHAYEELFEKLYGYNHSDPYESDPSLADMTGLHSGDPVEFDQDVAMFLDEGVSLGLRTNWLRRVLHPMVSAHAAYKNKDDPDRFETALKIIRNCRAPDWRRAGVEWLGRRKTEAQRAADDGVQHG